ncbi:MULTISPECIES: sporulation delaying protein family toxin [unclassified Streptomyces]|uniref:sporulation delaying protein family toxin n=1 Tax=unclassified Streptomyces TaxID=2593676 RepID=UPI002250A4EA|nr:MULTISPECIES: sporulation delaying protein family toxin [unclassified Streptomyces]MCX4405369.1 sporulation delaying protein family toxin [Streptomyces sp. NBC_01764]MCX5190079.1 sporulation delaying protein family toxin [Streptomyces sp. NBC_00268]
MQFKKAAISTALAAVTSVTAVAGTASAQTPAAPHAASAIAAKATGAYSDSDVVGFLVFGQGRAAADHAELAKEIRSRRSDPKVSAPQLAYLMGKLHQADPAFHARVTEAVQSKDPFVVRQGMVALNDDLKKSITSDRTSKTMSADSVMRPNGWVWTKSNIVTVANVAAGINVAAGANVAAAAEAVVVVVIVPAAASYGFDLQQSDQLDENDFVAAVTSAL